MSQDQYDAGYLPDDADCDQDLVRFHLGASHEFYTDIIEQLAEQLAKANERIEQLEEQNNFLKRPVNEQIKKANERVAELELIVVAITHADETGYVDDVGFVENWSQVCDETKALLNKFAIEKKVEGAKFYGEQVQKLGFNSVSKFTESVCEQLRKEQE